MVKLLDTPQHHMHLTVGGTAPTGDVGIKLRRAHQQDEGYIHYGMQLGSGTWDLKPSLTYTGKLDDWSWGAQISGTKHLEDKSSSGFAFGDLFQSTAWGGYHLTHWLSASVRGVYTVQGAVNGQFKPTAGSVKGKLVIMNPNAGPMVPGQLWRTLGRRLWLTQSCPVVNWQAIVLVLNGCNRYSTDANGYQLDREGALSASWSYAF
jgi:hypothetical protein